MTELERIDFLCYKQIVKQSDKTKLFDVHGQIWNSEFMKGMGMKSSQVSLLVEKKLNELDHNLKRVLEYRTFAFVV
jgi:hypothetical protein